MFIYTLTYILDSEWSEEAIGSIQRRAFWLFIFYCFPLYECSDLNVHNFLSSDVLFQTFYSIIKTPKNTDKWHIYDFIIVIP